MLPIPRIIGLTLYERHAHANLERKEKVQTLPVWSYTGPTIHQRCDLVTLEKKEKEEKEPLSEKGESSHS